jgi:hypothetical protein
MQLVPIRIAGIASAEATIDRLIVFGLPLGIQSPPERTTQGRMSWQKSKWETAGE